MATGDTIIKARDVVPEAFITVHLKGYHWVMFRYWLAIRILDVAAWIMPGTVTIDFADQPTEGD